MSNTVPASDSQDGFAFVPRPGMVPVEGYVLVEKLGSGGFGEVWRAEAPGGLSVAMKLIPLGKASDAAELRSIELMKNVRHPHLLGMFGVWEERGYLVVAMELADGTLMDRLKEARQAGQAGLPREELLGYMHEGAKGIDFLNAHGIQHRDIKPQNLLLVGGAVKVADFGLAKLLQHSMTGHTGMLTPSFAAPEFFRGHTASTSDQYSLAVTYCMLRSGKLPFTGGPADVMLGHLSEPPDLSMLPSGERPIVARALAKDPKDRWPSCRVFVQALQATDETHPGTPPVETVKEVPSTAPVSSRTPPRSPRQRRTLAVLVTAALLATLLFPAILLFIGRKPSPPPQEAPPPRPTPVPVASTVPVVPPVEPPPPVVRVLRILSVSDVKVEAGQKALLTAALETKNLSDAVKLAISGLPSGVSARPIPSAAEKERVQVEIVAGSEAAAGEAGPVVTATAGQVRDSRSFRLTVTRPVVRPPPPPPPVVIRLFPLPSVELDAGESRSVTARLERQNYEGPIELRVEGLPEGVTAGMETVRAGATQGRLELRALPTAPAATKKVTVLARAASVEDRADMMVIVRKKEIVKPPPPPPAMLKLKPPTGAVVLGLTEPGTVKVEVERTSYDGDVEVRLTDLPRGVTSELVTLPPGKAVATLSLERQKDAPAVISTRVKVIATATKGKARAEGSFPLTVLGTISNSIGMRLALIPPGRAVLGSPQTEMDRRPDETLHEVQLTRPYYLGVFEVTQAEYEQVMGKNPAMFQSRPTGGPDHPVEQVSWADAEKFCQMLSDLPEEKKAGRRYRLPTEAEWEYACRAGTRTPFWVGEGISSKVASFDGKYPYGGEPKGTYAGRTLPVGSVGGPNPFGLYDMHGNVSEWCLDWYGEGYYSVSPGADPPGPAEGEKKVVRGGCWRDPGHGCRSARRSDLFPDTHSPHNGLRVLLEAPGSSR